MVNSNFAYRGRIAPSPTGLLHLGHAATFWRAQERARAAGGTLILRLEDLDRSRCRPDFVEATYRDLRWLGLSWVEGPDEGGPHAPYQQSARGPLYLAAWQKLRAGGFIYPCLCSRKDVLSAAGAPHQENEEPVYPGTCRTGLAGARSAPGGVNWRFRVPAGETLEFDDARLGARTAVAGRDFGDFLIWRNDDVPAYQLAVVVDDAAMEITEVVRGEDLLLSTFRQLLLYRTLELRPPRFLHTPLVLDELGRRLAKRDDSHSLQAIRSAGSSPEDVRHRCLE